MTISRPVLIIGTGAIGAAFAAAFRAGGRDVILTDPDAAARDAAPGAVARHGAMLRRAGLPEAPSPGTLSVTDALPSDAMLAIECGPERADIKAAIFADLLAALPADAPLATASSSLPISAVVALPREANRLVDEGAVDVEGIDRLVRDGLGPRRALGGPFETEDLNTAGGIRGHAERLGPACAAIGAAWGETAPSRSPALVDRVEAERRAILPEAELPARCEWREAALADLLRARAGILVAGSGE